MFVTALAGFLASVGLLKLGLDQMWLRYPLAVLIAWGVFLLLVRRWAEQERSSMRVDEELGSPEARSDDAPADRKSVWDGPAPEARLWRYDWLNWIELEEGCLVIIAVAVVVTLLVGTALAIGGLIMEAEAVLAEVLLDAILVSALYRGLRKKEVDWWSDGPVRQTVKPVLKTMASLMIIGILLHYYAPEARSIGGAWRHWRVAH